MTAARRVICLHGLGRTPDDWNAARERLGEFGEVVTPAVPLVPAAALELLDPLITDEAIVIGHSMGAVLAMQVIERRPRPLRAAVLAGAFFAPARNGRSAGATVLDYGAHRIAFIRDAIRDRAQRPRTPVRPLSTLARLALSPGDLEPALDRSASSVLVVHASDDHHVPVSFALAAARRHPNWDVRVLDRGGHHAHVSQPAAWSDAVTWWLGAVRADAS